MNIHLPAILGFTRYQGFDPSPLDCTNYCNINLISWFSWRLRTDPTWELLRNQAGCLWDLRPRNTLDSDTNCGQGHILLLPFFCHFRTYMILYHFTSGQLESLLSSRQKNILATAFDGSSCDVGSLVSGQRVPAILTLCETRRKPWDFEDLRSEFFWDPKLNPIAL